MTVLSVTCHLLPATLPLSGCDWIGKQADNLGEHMPVVGERCEHWQCITPSGQAASDTNKQKMQQAGHPAAPAAPLPSPDSISQNVTPAASEHNMGATAPQ
jgi:hypothetical protein